MTKRLVIIGGDAAGMSAAAQARRMSSPDQLEIVAFERTSRTSYSACGLPYLVGGFVTEPESLVARTPEQHRANGIDVRTRHEVIAIDTRASAVTVRNLDTAAESALGYDELLISTGASGVAPPWPGSDALGVLQLRTLDDAARVERLVVAGARRAVVVGAGYIGLEVAEALLERGLAVTVVERLDAPMSAVLDDDVAAEIAQVMRDAGIDMQLGTSVTGFTTTADGRVAAVDTSAGLVPANLVLIGLGVSPNVELARAAGIGIGAAGGIVVDDHLRTSSPHVGLQVTAWNRAIASPGARSWWRWVRTPTSRAASPAPTSPVAMRPSVAYSARPLPGSRRSRSREPVSPSVRLQRPDWMPSQ